MTNESSMIEKYTTDMTAQVAKDLDKYSIVGRDNEIHEVIVALRRSIKNSPVLIGEPGVGKTAIVEGVAKYIVENLDGSLGQSKVIDLDIASMMEANFEVAFKRLLREITESKDHFILFIDEIHMIVGAGNSNGAIDAGNMLKPALARGDFKLIGATTTDEYYKYIAPDDALERRFIDVPVNEPDIPTTIAILNTKKQRFEREQAVTITEEAVKFAVESSIRYITTKQLPDKAIDLIDSAAARANIEGKSVVDEQAVVMELENLTGIPAESLSKSVADRMRNMRQKLNAHVIGQPRAVDSVMKVIKRNITGLAKSTKPLASLFFVGPTGVGKTELVKTLAEMMFDSEENITRFDMSEFNQPNSVVTFVDRLTKAVDYAPYTVVLFDEIEKANSSVFDIMLQIFQDGILTNERGKTISFRNTIIILTSNQGHNLLSDHRTVAHMTKGQLSEEDHQLVTNIRDELMGTFRSELINRLDDIVIFNFLDREDIVKVARLMLDSVIRQFKRSYPGVDLLYDDQLVDYIANVGFDELYGARPIERAIQDKFLDPLSDLILSTIAVETPISEIEVKLSGEYDKQGKYDSRQVKFSYAL